MEPQAFETWRRNLVNDLRQLRINDDQIFRIMAGELEVKKKQAFVSCPHSACLGRYCDALEACETILKGEKKEL